MGLDIYLRKCRDLPAALAAEAAAEAESSALWPEGVPYEEVPEATREEIRAKGEQIALKHGLTGRYGHHESITGFDSQDSKIAPDHMFKVGYFRSSYNDGGIECVMRKLGLPTLDIIFDAPEDCNDFHPDWDAALARVSAAIDGYAAHLDSDIGKYQVMELRPMHEFGVATEKDALELFAKTLRESGTRGWDSSAFSNRDGEYWLAGITVRALITKTFRPAADGNVIDRLINRPTTFVVYDRETDDGKEDWYLTALRIVKETCEFVLDQPDKQHFYLVWSG